jgi:hypothetical protein
MSARGRMSPRGMRSTGSKLTVLALLVAAIAFVVQVAAGVTDTPTIPPGLVAILVAAGLVAFLPGRSVPLAGPAAGLFNLVAFVLTGAADRLVQPSPASAFVGAWLMIVALVVATITGAIATVQNHRTRPVPVTRKSRSEARLRVQNREFPGPGGPGDVFVGVPIDEHDRSRSSSGRS